ncbi:MAG: ribosome-associated translation inhibitor RaiA [Chloroflexota bacterium]|nr:ribosome-associated translation inhibitor RaiA [Chloroflexota bacterium]
MRLIIRGKNIEVADSLRRRIEKKVSKLDRYLPTADEARVELSVERTKSAEDRQVVQLTLKDGRTMLRAEERSNDMFASLDAALDKIRRQIRRYKGRRRDRWQGKLKGKPPAVGYEEEAPPHIVKVKSFQMNPMGEEEAIEQMELLGHDFFVFFNVDTGSINILYRRRDGNYGLIQPELA